MNLYHRKPGLWTVWAMVGLAALLATACGGAEEPTATPRPAAPTATTAPVVQPTAAPAPTATRAPIATAAPTATPAAVATPTAAPTTPPAAIKPTGTLTVAVGLPSSGVGTPSGWPTDCLWCASLVMVGVQEAILAIERGPDGGIAVGSWLAQSWKTAPDLKYTDFSLKQGVQFHKGFGELTAADVVYTYGASDPAVTKEARHDTLPNPSLGKVEEIDRYTVRFNWKAFSGETLFQFTDFGEGIGIFPKKAADEKGTEWMRSNVIGTGPYEMVEWTAQKGIYLKAIPEHWRKVAWVENWRILEIPEDATRLAMMETNEAQIGEVDLKSWPDLFKKGYKQAPEGITNGVQIIIGGNYWEKKHHQTGEPVDRKLDTTKPWVGDPWAPGCDYADVTATVPAKTPCDALERPRKVRWALTSSIDREAINDTILMGLGRPLYGYMFQDDLIWKTHKDRWKVDYDLAKAKQLLKEAGYENGLTLQWWVGPAGANVEISEAIGATWLNELKIKVDFDRRTYSTMRPSLVSREAAFLQTRNCCGGPAAWSGEWILSSSVPTGYNHGMELPKASEVYYKKIKENDPKVLEQLTVEMQDHLYHWMFMPSVVDSPAAAIYNTRAVGEWKMRPYSQWRIAGIRNLEWVKQAQ